MEAFEIHAGWDRIDIVNSSDWLFRRQSLVKVCRMSPRQTTQRDVDRSPGVADVQKLIDIHIS
jgi:hypothetical protein